MKLFLLFLVLILIPCAFLAAQATVQLSEALLTAAVRISRELPEGSTAAVTAFNSESDELNEYARDELYGAILRTRRINLVDQNENPQYLVTGTITRTGSEYGFRVIAVTGETSEKISEYFTVLAPEDPQLVRLLGINSAVPEIAASASGRSSASPARADSSARTSRPVREPDPRRLNSIGVSVGSSFEIPFYIATVYGTFSPLRNTFIEVGMDLGWGIRGNKYGYDEKTGHFSLFPYARYAFFFGNNNISFYFGIGGGAFFGTYTFPEGKASRVIPAADASIGMIFHGFTISYSVRKGFVGSTSFFNSSLTNKVTIGYLYKFK